MLTRYFVHLDVFIHVCVNFLPPFVKLGCSKSIFSSYGKPWWPWFFILMNSIHRISQIGIILVSLLHYNKHTLYFKRLRLQLNKIILYFTLFWNIFLQWPFFNSKKKCELFTFFSYPRNITACLLSFWTPKQCKALMKELMKTPNALHCRTSKPFLNNSDLVSYLGILQSGNISQKANFEKISKFSKTLDVCKYVRAPSMLFHLYFW